MRTLYSTHRFLPLMMITFCLAACTAEEKSDAYGQFETERTTVSVESGGKLIRFTVNEGDRLKENQQVGLIDTTQLVLKRRELEARLNAVASGIAHIDAQVAVQREQLETARADLKRTLSLFNEGAATQKQLDDVQAQVRTFQKQVHALSTQKQSVLAEIQATEARINQLEEQIRDTRIINPINGTVLVTYAEPHELVQSGHPLYQIAGLDTLELRVYISGAQLPAVKLGQQVQVLVDKNRKENQQMNGTVSWIASEAEFTPKMIQTKEERVTQVYAVKIRVPNPDGTLKVGMPGEVNLAAGR